MQLQFFTIPIQGVSDYNEALNQFLRSKKVVQIEKQLLSSDGGSFWCVCITYIEPSVVDRASKEKVDYMKTLSPEVFSVFSILRKIRKEIAEKENVSAFVVFTDSELATMAAMEELTIEHIKNMSGIGRSKVDKYGIPLLRAYKKQQDEA